MRRFWSALALALPIATVGQPAHACRDINEANLNDLKHADVVVAGRIANYSIVPTQKVRDHCKAELAKPDLSDLQRHMCSRNMFVEDYARFDIHVDEILLGTAAETLTVTWDAQTQTEPTSMSAGPYVIALSEPNRLPAAIVPGAELRPTVLHLICRDAFIFPVGSKKAEDIRQALSSRPK